MKADGIVLAIGSNSFLSHAGDLTMLGYRDGTLHESRTFYLYGALVDDLRGGQPCGGVGKLARHRTGQVSALLCRLGGRARVLECDEQQGP